jgi:hypothetical protein
VQGIFSKRLRKRIDANTLTNGQTNGQTNSQAEYNAVPKMGTAIKVLSKPKWRTMSWHTILK